MFVEVMPIKMYLYRAISERRTANAACVAAGGTLDVGHRNAVTWCQKKLTEWTAKVVV